MVGCHHQFNGHEFEQASGVGDGQGGLRAAVHGVAKSGTRLRDQTELKELGEEPIRGRGFSSYSH